MPSVTLNDVDYSFETDGYRDAVCSLINQIVKEVKMQDNVSIKIIFESDDILSIFPTQSDRETIVEFALYHCGNDIWVWN